jgi:hypothetical protein
MSTINDLKNEVDKLRDHMPVGTVIASVLKPDVFFQIYNREYWEPADGSLPPDNSHYRIIQDHFNDNEHVPDLRGRFIRGLNNLGGDNQDEKNGDPENTRKVMSYQSDSTRIPEKVSLSHEKDHKHNVSLNAGDCSTMVPDGATQRLAHYKDDGYGAGNPKESSPGGGHTHTISGSDVETRPKNVALYFYVKIRAY